MFDELYALLPYPVGMRLFLYLLFPMLLLVLCSMQEFLAVVSTNQLKDHYLLYRSLAGLLQKLGLMRQSFLWN